VNQMMTCPAPPGVTPKSLARRGSIASQMRRAAALKNAAAASKVTVTDEA
jgi:hypothetical protein